MIDTHIWDTDGDGVPDAIDTDLDGTPDSSLNLNNFTTKSALKEYPYEGPAPRTLERFLHFIRDADYGAFGRGLGLAADHVNILGNNALITDVLRIATGMAHQVS